MIKVGVLGGSGYTAGELLRILLKHPKIKITTVISTTKVGLSISKIHKDLVGDSNLYFSDHLEEELDVIFLCIGNNYNNYKEILKSISYKTAIIDIGNEFRLLKFSNFQGRYFIYGLPELYFYKIKKARNITNPGCFATAIQLALLPLANLSLLTEDIHISAITGSSGAGAGNRAIFSEFLTQEINFNFRTNNITNYKLFSHQHIKEVYQNLKFLQKNFNKKIYFIPYKGNFTRGIFITIYIRSSFSLKEIEKIYKSYYRGHLFTYLSDTSIYLKQVINTNKCLLHLDKENGYLIISAVLDNLLKGASGQAIHNLNLMYGYEETCGLELKALAI